MWYRSGTVSATNGSTAVTGSGTDWISGAGVGESFYGPDGRLYEIAAITSATTLTLGSAYLGATTSGQAYQIVPTQSYIRDLAAQAAQLVADYGNVVSNVGAGKFQDGTLAQPGLRFASDENTGIRHASSDELRLVAGGVDQARVSVAGLSVDQGKLVLEGASVANGVAYLNGSKQLVAGSGLTFDNSGRLLVGVTSAPSNAPSGSIQYHSGAHLSSGGFGRFWVPGQSIGAAAYAGRFALANTYNAYYSGGWKSIGGGTATAITIDEGNFSVSVSDGVGAADTALTWTTVLNTTKGKTVSLEGTSPATGTGITFPATQVESSDANTLDDYEEGTWTPVGDFDGVSITSYTTQYGIYTKVGRVVTVSGRIVVGVKGSGTGLFRIYGLPYTSGSFGYTPTFSGSCVAVSSITGITGTLGIWLDNGGAFLVPFVNENGAGGFTFGGNWQNGSAMTFTMTYFV